MPKGANRTARYAVLDAGGQVIGRVTLPLVASSRMTNRAIQLARRKWPAAVGVRPYSRLSAAQQRTADAGEGVEASAADLAATRKQDAGDFWRA